MDQEKLENEAWLGRAGLRVLLSLITAAVFHAGCASPETGPGAPPAADSAARAFTVSSVKTNETAEPADRADARQHYAIDLESALRLADAGNHQIVLARERVQEARAQLRQSQFQLLPDLRFGASYIYQDGLLQDTEGTTVDVKRSGSMAGLGTGTVGAGLSSVPGVQVTSDLSEAIFGTLAARQNTRAAEASSQSTQHQMLLKVALAYYELLRAKARTAIAEEVYHNASELAELTAKFARSGEGLESDAERAAVEKLVQQRVLSQAVEAMELRSVALAELLRLSQATQLDPVETEVFPVDITPLESTAEQLVAVALQDRPEIRGQISRVKQADFRLQEARYDPLIPIISAGVSSGGFAGDTDASPGDFRNRTEFGAAIYWELQGLGLSYVQRTKERRSQHNQAKIQARELADRIASEVRQGHIQVISQRKQMKVLAQAVHRALKSFQLNRARVFENQGLPIEVLESIQALGRARNLYLDAVVAYNESQFRLYTAVGQPASAALAPGNHADPAGPATPQP